MKRMIFLLAALFLCLCPIASAEGVSVEVIRADGVSVVVLTPQETLMLGGAKGADGFALPRTLTQIEEGAFEGIEAECVEISENVVSVGARAFADCKNLRELHIPAGVRKVDDTALDGCENVTVYGKANTEAARFAEAAGFPFADPDAAPEHPALPPEKPPVELPVISR